MQRGGVLHHRRRDDGVEVEGRDHRHPVTDGGAATAQHLAIAVFQVFRHHGPVQVQIQGINGTGRRQIVEEPARDGLEGAFRGVGRGNGETPQ